MNKIIFILFTLSLNTFALPEHVHFFFISGDGVSLMRKIEDGQIRFSELTAKNVLEEDPECVPMGDGCFHPQLGYVEKTTIAVKERPTQVPQNTINAVDIDLIKCEDGNYFDIFCGKAKKESTEKALVEIWIDTSSSMRSVDYSKDPNYCQRRIVARKFREGCAEKVNIQLFDTSLKEMGDLSSSCVNYGLNDQKRLMRWIKDSSAKQLYVLTDIDELSLELKDFLDSIPATIYGGEGKRYYMKDVQEMTEKTVSKYCK
ncbi:hypothetical protein [Halobacteriovorax sp.]|uniref:hypothetical protein n=1 Tax=Halobacteriovorax sp. TaxID=2020862 RepID=UPI003566DA50